MNSSLSLSDLPPDLTRHVAGRLSPRGLARLGSTSRGHRNALRDRMDDFARASRHARRGVSAAAKAVERVIRKVLNEAERDPDWAEYDAEGRIAGGVRLSAWLERLGGADDPLRLLLEFRAPGWDLQHDVLLHSHDVERLGTSSEGSVPAATRAMLNAATAEALRNLRNL